jgi:hypothetical protein
MTAGTSRSQHCTVLFKTTRTLAAVVVTISFRMVPLLLKDPSKGNALHPGLVQSLSRGLSLASSLSATVVVAITAWSVPDPVANEDCR